MVSTHIQNFLPLIKYKMQSAWIQKKSKKKSQER